MSRFWCPKLAAALAAVAAFSTVPVAAAGGPARANAPAPGEPCTQLQASTQDANGRTMWCGPAKAGDTQLVWQYGILVVPSPPVTG